MASSASVSPAQVSWSPQPQAAELIDRLTTRMLQRLPGLARLADRMRSETGTRLSDWLDHLAVSAEQLGAVSVPDGQQILLDLGFQREPGELDVFRHVQGDFPALRWVEDPSQTPVGIALRVEDVDDFLRAQRITARQLETPGIPAGGREAELIGPPGAAVRWVAFERQGPCTAWAVERHGAQRMAAQPAPDADQEALEQARHLLAERPRTLDDDVERGYREVMDRIRQANALVGPDRTCDLFFAAERQYWQSRNRAAQVQRARQDRLGLGWANHDHHTYRSGRTAFVHLIAALELLGFGCRERFYAGREAGWGAQVLEHGPTGIVIFADVDLSPEEVSEDFAHQPLAPRDRLGTVGLWCALHGESFLAAGLHHLECQFDFQAACEQLAAEGIAIMPPFTDLPYLKQAFTEAEFWPVDAARIRQAEENRWIDAAQAETFRRQGARGSHLEILQRDQGYKGFNPQGISDIIRRTDPRAVETGSA